MSRIGVDVDGVLANFNLSFIERTIEVTGRDLFPTRPFDIPCWNYPEFYGYTSKETSQIWESIKADKGFWYDLLPYADTDYAMVYLSRLEVTHDIYFITSRPGLNAKSQTEWWLQVQFENVGQSIVPTVLISSDKRMCATALELDVYIDDRWENALAVAGTNTKSVLMTRPWNAEYDADAFGITRTNTVLGFAGS